MTKNTKTTKTKTKKINLLVTTHRLGYAENMNMNCELTQLFTQYTKKKYRFKVLN